MLAQNGSIDLADFGLTRIATAGESTLSADSMLDTPHYMSPEQARGLRDLGAGTDIYSFGIVLYELTVRRMPFSPNTPLAVIHDHIFAPLSLPHIANPTVTEPAERVVLKAFAKERTDRYPEVVTFVRAFLEATAAHGAAASTRLPPAPVPTRVSASAVRRFSWLRHPWRPRRRQTARPPSGGPSGYPGRHSRPAGQPVPAGRMACPAGGLSATLRTTPPKDAKLKPPVLTSEQLMVSTARCSS